MTLPDQTRRSLYSLLIVVAVAMAAGRVLGVVLVYEPDIHRPENAPTNDGRRTWPKATPEPMPTFSSNDRSRWATVRSLVDEGTYVIGKRDPQTKRDSGIVFEDGWQTVDKVLHPEKLEYYSSKPPLLSTIVAGEYWLLKKLFGWSFANNRWEIVRTILFVMNVLPFGFYLWLLSKLLDRQGGSDWAKLFLLTTACFGTLVTPFLITLNNHTVAVVSVTLAIYAVVRILERPDASFGWAIVAGLAAGFTAANELPAAAFVGGIFVLLAIRMPSRSVVFLLASAIPILALLGVNYLALGRLRPAYSEFGGPWYEYEGSHWLTTPGVVRHGIDWAGRNGETKGVYTFHLLLGHHGFFSLTPVFLLSLVGFVVAFFMIRKATPSDGAADKPIDPFFYPLCFSVSLIVIGFYIFQSDNYGGWSNGPRWLMWLTPLWLLAAVKPLDWLEKWAWGRRLALLLLAISVLSASYSPWNPWRHPWLYRFFESQGWISY